MFQKLVSQCVPKVIGVSHVNSGRNSLLLPMFRREMSLLSGFKDKINTKIQEKQEEKRVVSFQNQITWLVNSKTFTLEEYYQHLEKNAGSIGANGWKSKLPGVSSQNEVKDVKRNLEILSKLTSEEKQDHSILQRREKLRVSLESGHPVEAVNKMLSEFEMLAGVRTWLQRRAAQGLPLPDSIEESQILAREDPKGFPRIRPKERRPRRRL